MESNKNLKTIGILQSSFLPWLGHFEQIYKSDIFVVYDDVQYDKNGWRNRNRIKALNGPLWLSVPIKANGFQLIKNAKIDYSSNWVTKLVKSIQYNYQKAPFFEQYTPDLFSIIEKRTEFLIDLNMELLHWVCLKIGLKSKIILSSELNIDGDRIERLTKMIKTLNGNYFYEGASGANYINIEDFKKEGIEICFQDYKHPVYKQLHGEFVSHLSIIDLLLNEGPNSLSILSNNEKK